MPGDQPPTDRATSKLVKSVIEGMAGHEEAIDGRESHRFSNECGCRTSLDLSRLVADGLQEGVLTLAPCDDASCVFGGDCTSL